MNIHGKHTSGVLPVLSRYIIRVLTVAPPPNLGSHILFQGKQFSKALIVLNSGKTTCFIIRLLSRRMHCRVGENPSPTPPHFSRGCARQPTRPFLCQIVWFMRYVKNRNGPGLSPPLPLSHGVRPMISSLVDPCLMMACALAGGNP